ncbi:MAG: hemerythrin domain-containing protein [Dehalococcoidia bacterium]|nr:hemerythrin domain-containing protein [Dehalococcoidia bacterium]
MATPTQPLRDEHKELLPHIAGLRAAADSVGEAPIEAVLRNVAESHEFLVDHLLPHAQAEERALYPVIARLMGAPEATATMSRDHVEVRRLTEELGALRSSLSGAALDPAQAKALRAVLYGLSALVKVHFAKEEEGYLPILDQRLTESEAGQMFEAMEAAASEARLPRSAPI